MPLFIHSINHSFIHSFSRLTVRVVSNALLARQLVTVTQTATHLLGAEKTSEKIFCLLHSAGALKLAITDAARSPHPSPHNSYLVEPAMTLSP